MLRASRFAVRNARLRNCYATTAPALPLSDLKPGFKLHDFTLQRVKRVPELELSAFQFLHDRTKAEYLHVSREDSNNVFSIGFKTNPPDDTGVPHILEHVTLCGSQKYPVRDPFFKMIPRSLANFMNALTSADHTTYPFATTNNQDFKNLMSVYLDATLNPLLREQDFRQEGWRVAPQTSPSPNLLHSSHESTKFVFKGVVYNEMKGQMSDAAYVFYTKYYDSIFPAINDSGGDPNSIPKLSHDALCQFHKNQYHPSNAKIFTYGNFAVEDHLKQLSAALKSFDQRSGELEVKSPTRLADGPHNITVQGPLDPMIPSDRQHKTSISWIMCPAADISEMFSLGVLSSLLLNGYGSPMYQALIEAGLGHDFTPNIGLDICGTSAVFSIGVTGVKDADVTKVPQVVTQALIAACDKGFSTEKVEGILHQLELDKRNKTANFGLGLMGNLLSAWFNKIDPLETLAWDEVIQKFRTNFEGGRYLEGLVEKYLLKDDQLIFVMEPAPDYEKTLAREEEKRVAEMMAEFEANADSAEHAKHKLVQAEEKLEQVQEAAKDEDISCLPSLHVGDISRTHTSKLTKASVADKVKIQWREAPTNGLTYVRILNVFEQLPGSLRPYIPLFCDSLLRLGTKSESIEELEERIKLKTGGISFGYHSTNTPQSLDVWEEGLAISSYALSQNVPHMYELLRTLLLDTDFDSPAAHEHITQLLQTSANGIISSLAESGSSFARSYAESNLTARGVADEQTKGLAQNRLILRLAATTEVSAVLEVVDKLKEIKLHAISQGSSLRAAVTCDAESVASNDTHLRQFLKSLPTNLPAFSASDSVADAVMRRKSFFQVPFQVNYVALALRTVPYLSKDSAALQILSQLLTHKLLHHEIREKFGAYGAGAYSRSLGGTFGMTSYRDPDPSNSIGVMSRAGSWAYDRNWSSRELEEAKITTFQAFDAPESVSAEGMNRFIHGIDDEMQQKRREQLLDVSKDDVKNVAQQYLVQAIDRANLVVLGDKRDWMEKAEEQWDVHDLGLSNQPATTGL